MDLAIDKLLIFENDKRMIDTTPENNIDLELIVIFFCAIRLV
jgi:hypothetical protein